MSTPITKIPKPDIDQFKEGRKLFLVPLFQIPYDAPEPGQQLAERYWSELRDSIHNLENSLGKLCAIYHEALFSDGDEGLKMLEKLNPRGYPFIKAMCQSNVSLELTENRALLEESSDWGRCIAMGLVSEKVMTAAVEGYQNTTSQRYEHISNQIDQTLTGKDPGILFISENHRVQFPSDIQIFYVAPPALDDLKRWINNQLRPTTETSENTQETNEKDNPV